MDKSLYEMLQKLGAADGKAAQAEMLARFEKVAQSFSDRMAMVAWSFYSSCAAKGFEPEQAMDLTKTYMTTVLMVTLQKPPGK